MSAIRIFERRLEMLRLYLQGIRPSRIVSQIVRDKSIDASERSLWRDWKSRGEWMPALTRLNEGAGDLPIAETMGALMEARRLAFNTYLRADNSNARVGALRIIKELVEAEIELRQSLGLLHRRAYQGRA